jgi:hypothetical protein
MRRVIFFCLLPLAGATVASAEWPRVPPVEGELAGKFLAPGYPAAPPLDWKITVRGVDKGRRRADLPADATGARLRMTADLDPATGDGSWRIDAGELDAAVWLRAVASNLGDVLAAAELTGKISVTGEGTLRGGAPAGTVAFALSDGRLTLPAQKLEFTGFALRATLGRLPDLSVAGELTFEAAHAAGLELGEGRIVFGYEEAGRLRVTEARVRGLGGVATVAPFAIQMAEPAIALTAALAGIDLDKIVAYLPAALSEAHGHVDGELAVNWSKVAGLTFGAGWMKLSDGAPATVRLAPTPGLITAQLKVGNPAFPALQRVELGQTPLHVRLLSAEFQPAGDALGRTASVHLEAAPIDPQLIAPLLMEVNVSGPLDQLIKIGLDDRMRVGGQR